MKTLFFIFASILVAQETLANCPELAGNYKLKGNENTTQVIKESTENGVKIYTLGEGAAPLVADGKIHTLGVVSMQATCKDNSISLSFTGPNKEIINGLIVKTATGYTFSSNNPKLMGDNAEWIKQ